MTEISRKNLFLSLYEKAMPDSLSLAEKSALLLAAGFDGLEISVDESDGRLARVLDDRVKQDTLAALRSASIPVRTMCLSGQRRFPFGSRDGEIRKQSLRLVQKAVDFSYDASIRVIQIPGYDVWYEERGTDTEQYFCEGLRLATDYAAQSGVILAFETMENGFMNTAEKAMAYVERINSPYLQVYPDTGNITNGTDDPVGDLKTARGHIVAAHLRDTLPEVFRDLEYGQGRVDFVPCMAELLAQGVRLLNWEFWYDGKTEPRKYIRRNLQYIIDCFGKAGVK